DARGVRCADRGELAPAMTATVYIPADAGALSVGAGEVAAAVAAEDLRRGGYRALARALALAPAEVVQTLTVSGLRGRGGAAFPTGIKWKTVLEQPPAQKYVTCNADEGDSGTFADRMLMEG